MAGAAAGHTLSRLVRALVMLLAATVACHEAMRLAFPADDAAPTR